MELQEVGGKLRPLSEITSVCARCRDQIEWKRKYGKYKPLSEPSKCQRCSKRAVRQAYHNLCPSCAKEQNVCAKCCCKVDHIPGRDLSEVEAEQRMLEEAIKNARERDRRTLLRAMNKGKSQSSEKASNKQASKVGELFPDATLEEYVGLSRDHYDSAVIKGSTNDEVENGSGKEEVDHGDKDEEDDNYGYESENDDEHDSEDKLRNLEVRNIH
ncbi:Protein of unknown function DUF2039 [Dillenia turbinata]|uniref:Uncharacterized protein n=1 Tax=Dillenia turbinata TaxID=194707 RepID=A0AAN8V5V8_9MAGN